MKKDRSTMDDDERQRRIDLPVPSIVLFLFLTAFSFSFTQEVFEKTFGGTEVDIGLDVKQTSDGGFIIAGMTMSYGAGSADVYLVRTDAWGIHVWDRTYGGSDEVRCQSMQNTVDGGYILAGSTSSYGAGSSDVYLIKTDDTGTVIWERTYGGPGNVGGNGTGHRSALIHLGRQI